MIVALPDHTHLLFMENSLHWLQQKFVMPESYSPGGSEYENVLKYREMLQLKTGKHTVESRKFKVL